MEAVNEGVEMVAFCGMELNKLVHLLRVMVLRYVFFLVLVPPRRGDLCHHLCAGVLCQVSCLSDKIAAVQKPSYGLHQFYCELVLELEALLAS